MLLPITPPLSLISLEYFGLFIWKEILTHEFDYELIMCFGARTDLVLIPGFTNTFYLYRLRQYFLTSLN